jgi:cation diffusion facilitator CzcD-associated flavoprotein CzcO
MANEARVPREGNAAPFVVIIGAGFGGIGTAVKLKRSGLDNFVVLEQSGGVGGTWLDNRFPGSNVDIHSALYSFSFYPYDWSRTHADQAELLRYLDEVVDHYGVRPHIQLNTKVVSLRWNDAAHTYTVKLDGGAELIANVVVSAVGLFNVPKYPDWPGVEKFKGPRFHTARWEHGHDLAGKRVAVVGTGSTASQVVPAIAPVVDKLYLFQREPGWLVEKGDRVYQEEEREYLRKPFRRRLRRYGIWLNWERTKDSIFPGKHNEYFQRQSEEYLAKVFKDRPDLREALTPRYPFWGKRPLISSNFYPALLRPNVELIPRAVTSVTEDGVVDSSGTERKIDVLVLATGFQPSNYLATFEVWGRDGRSIHQVWNGEPCAFVGAAVANFPNFYLLYGPNTNASPDALSYIERGQDYAVRAVRRMVCKGVTAIEVRKDMMDRYNDWLQQRLTTAVFQYTNNYYKASTGKNVTQFCHGGTVFWLLTRTLGRIPTVERRLRADGTATQDRAAPLAELRFGIVLRAAEALSAVINHLPAVDLASVGVRQPEEPKAQVATALAASKGKD